MRPCFSSWVIQSNKEDSCLTLCGFSISGNPFSQYKTLDCFDRRPSIPRRLPKFYRQHSAKQIRAVSSVLIRLHDLREVVANESSLGSFELLNEATRSVGSLS